MLVLSRKANESIKIGENITVIVTGIRGDRVRLGIEAPADVKIMRTELGVLQKEEKRDEGGEGP
jgi:carbon storage regulator